MQEDATRIILVASTAHCQVFFDDELQTHITGFNTREGWIDQIHINHDGSYPTVRRHGKVEAIYDPKVGG